MRVFLYYMSVYRHMSVEVKDCAPYFFFFDLALTYFGGDGEGEAHYGPHGLQRTTWVSLFRIQQSGFWGLNSGHKTYPKAPLTCCVVPATLYLLWRLHLSLSTEHED